MENHPIPQDVTGFKFKLIGSVTVKQFLYLLGFGILATVSFMVFQTNFFLMVPSVVFFAGIGAALAFLPVEGRPMDTMLANFIKVIPSENRFIYRKRGANLAHYALFEKTVKITAAPVQKTQAQQTQEDTSDKRAMLISRLRNSGFRPDEQESRALSNIKTFFDDDAKDGKASKKSVVNAAKLAEVYAVNISTPANTGTIHTTTVVTPPKPFVEPKKNTIAKVPEAVQEAAKQEVEKALKGTPKEPTQVGPAEIQTPQEQAPALTLSKVDDTNKPPEIQVPKVELGWGTQSGNLPAGFPSLPDVANVVLGIVRDSRGKSLPNVLVEVVDAGGIPVRAFKTNALGQFASATPLPNGIYKIYFDDPAKLHTISPIDTELKGEIFQPIEAVSVDDREKLRRELFGAGAPTN